MRNKYVGSFILLFIFQMGLSQTPQFVWAKRAGLQGNDAAEAMVTDKDDNLIVVGQYQGVNIPFDSTFIPTDNSRYFIVKFDPQGDVLWGKGAMGSGNAQGHSVQIDNEGNIIVGGSFTTYQVAFDHVTLTNQGSWDFFVVKYDPEGNVLWAKQGGGNDHDNLGGMALDPDGNILMTGRFQSDSIVLDHVVLHNVYPEGDKMDVFLVKYDVDGNVLWAKNPGGDQSDEGNDISTDSEGNVYLTGKYQDDSILFDSIPLNNYGYLDIFLAKYDPDGNILWANNAGGPGSDYVYALGMDSESNILISGYFSSDSIRFGNIALKNTVDYGVFDIFLAKYDRQGNVIWAKSAKGRSIDSCYDLVVDHDDNIILTGAFGGDSIDFGSSLLTSEGGGGVYVVKYNDEGNDLWATSIHGPGLEEGFAVTVSRKNEIYVAGGFWSDTLYAGSHVLANYDTSGNSRDLFVAKISELNTGIGEAIDQHVEWSLYPNPSSGTVHVESDANVEEIIISDLMGRIVHHAYPCEHTFDVAVHHPGIYFIVVRTGVKSAVRMLIIQE